MKILLVVLLIIPGMGLASEICPETVEATIAPAHKGSWRVMNQHFGGNSTFSLSNIFFYNKDPVLNMLLKYSESTKRGAVLVESYDMTGMDAWVACSYFDAKSKSSFRLTKKLLSQKRCDIISSSNGRIHLDCR